MACISNSFIVRPGFFIVLDGTAGIGLARSKTAEVLKLGPCYESKISRNSNLPVVVELSSIYSSKLS